MELLHQLLKVCCNTRTLTLRGGILDMILFQDIKHLKTLNLVYPTSINYNNDIVDLSHLESLTILYREDFNLSEVSGNLINTLNCASNLTYLSMTWNHNTNDLESFIASNTTIKTLDIQIKGETDL